MRRAGDADEVPRHTRIHPAVKVTAVVCESDRATRDTLVVGLEGAERPIAARVTVAAGSDLALEQVDLGAGHRQAVPVDAADQDLVRGRSA